MTCKNYCNLLVVGLFARIGRGYEKRPGAVAYDALSQTELPTRIQEGILTKPAGIDKILLLTLSRRTGLGADGHFGVGNTFGLAGLIAVDNGD